MDTTRFNLRSVSRRTTTAAALPGRLARLAIATGLLAPFALAATSSLDASENESQLAEVHEVRQFEPIEAKAVRIVSSQAVPAKGRAAAAAEHRQSAWSYYDRGDWARANDAFLSAIEQNPGDLESAEGLAMSVYRSGDFRAAYRLGKELASVMPSLARLVSGSVEADVRDFMNEGDLAGARALLRHFPATEDLYARLHRMVSDIDALASGLERSGGPDAD